MRDWLQRYSARFEAQGLSQKVAPVLLVVLILYLCWKLASLFWLVLAPPQTHQADTVALGSQQSQLPNIANFALFYEQGQIDERQDEQLNLSLQGVMVAYPSQFSSAVIKVLNQAERYRVGDRLEGSNYQLAEVEWNRVVLRTTSGATRTLAFEGIQNGLYQPMGQDSPQVPVSNSMQNNSTNQTTQQIGQATQRLQENREQFLQEMGVQNSGDGYEVSSRTPAALRNKLGLQPGDRIVSLNGQNLSSGQTEAQLLEQARQQGQVRLEIKRGDQVMTIQQDLK